MTPDRQEALEANKILGAFDKSIENHVDTCIVTPGDGHSAYDEYTVELPDWLIKDIRSALTRLSKLEPIIQEGDGGGCEPPIEGLAEAVEEFRPHYERSMQRIESFFGMNKDRPQKTASDLIFEAARRELARQGGSDGA